MWGTQAHIGGEGGGKGGGDNSNHVMGQFIL